MTVELVARPPSYDARDASDTYTYGYNQDNRLVTASLNGTVVGSYLYNAFGQRAVKSAASVATHFLYDTSGHLIAEVTLPPPFNPG